MISATFCIVRVGMKTELSEGTITCRLKFTYPDAIRPCPLLLSHFFIFKISTGRFNEGVCFGLTVKADQVNFFVMVLCGKIDFLHTRMTTGASRRAPWARIADNYTE